MIAPRDALLDLAPLVRRAHGLDPRCVVRLRVAEASASALVQLPFGVLAARTIGADPALAATDVTVRAEDLLQWLDGASPEAPAAADALWRWGVPPVAGWRRVETVPDTAIRPLVRAGALTLKEAAQREGVPGAQPRAQAADALLDSVVLTVETDDGLLRAEVTLRALSALTRMGFLARDSAAHVDVAGRWTRVAAVYGSVFLERDALDLTVR